MTRTLLLLLIALFFPACASTATSQADDLVRQWEESDGAAFLEVGSQLTDVALRQPTAFFSAFFENETAYESWLATIDTHSFRDFDGDSTAKLHARLQSLQSRAARYSSHPRYGPLATKLRQRLDSVVVTAVD